DDSEALALAAAIQQGSEHPLAEAVLRAAEEQQLDLPKASNIKALAGRGLSADINSQRLLLGNTRLMQEHDVDLAPLQQQASDYMDSGNTLSWLARIDGQPQLLAILAFGDTLKPEAAAAVAALKS